MQHSQAWQKIHTQIKPGINQGLQLKCRTNECTE